MPYEDWGTWVKRRQGPVSGGIQSEFENMAITLPVQPIVPQPTPQPVPEPPPQLPPQEPWEPGMPGHPWEPPVIPERPGPPVPSPTPSPTPTPVIPSPTPVIPAPTPEPAPIQPPSPIIPNPNPPVPQPAPGRPGPVTPMPGTFDPNDPWKGYGSLEAYKNEIKRRIDIKLTGKEGVDWEWAILPGGGREKRHIGDIWA